MIGIFDSGIGGLTVVKEIKKYLPDQQILYFGDTARVPWGNKSKQTVRRYCEEICNFLVSKKATTIVIACNTASALAGEYLEKKFNTVKFYNVIDPCVETIERNGFATIGVIGTRATIGSGAYAKKIKSSDKKRKVILIACPLFVPLVEEGWVAGKIPMEIGKKYLKPFKGHKVDALVLGCTHYPLLAKMIRGIIGEGPKIISSAQEVAKKISKEITLNKSDQAEDQFYFSDWDEHLQAIASLIIKKQVKAKKIILPLS